MKIFHDKSWSFDIAVDSFFDNRVLAIYEISIASNILCKLGNPVNRQNVIIEVDGYLEVHIRQILEVYLSETMNYRTSIRYNCITQGVQVKIISNTDYIIYLPNKEPANEECLLLYSKGLDSRLAYALLSEKFTVHKVSWEENGINSQNICKNLPKASKDIHNYTYIDTLDNDPWDDYGLYFMYMASILNNAICIGISNIAIGLNKDDLYGYDVVSSFKIYSQCSQSKEFISAFQKVSDIYRVKILMPLAELTRTEICKNILQRNIDISDSVSCVFFDKIECGMCFSCFDKLAGLLIALAELKETANVDIIMYKKVYELVYNGKILMKFKNDIRFFTSLEKLPIDYIMLLQLNRIILGEDKNYIMSSKFSVINILELLQYYSKHKIGILLFPKASALYNNFVDKEVFSEFIR